jgi:hypothetical protein
MDIIKETVLDYVSKKSVNNAILIKGDWGSGKTFYWNNVLKQAIKVKLNKEKLIEDNEDNNAVKYISLYGIDSIDALKKEIFSQFISFSTIKDEVLSKEGKINMGKFTASAAKFIAQATGNHFNIGNKELTMDYEGLINLNNVVICFDDLERTTIGLDEVLGYINNLVEHSGVKVILLANEDEIKCENYIKTKEKLIGKTLLHEINVENIFTEILKPNFISNEFLRNDLVRNKSKLIEVFERCGSNNLRIFIQSLGDLESIYNAAGQEIIQNLDNANKDSLIIFTVTLSLAVKTNGISTSLFKTTVSSEDFNTNLIGAEMIERHRKKGDDTTPLEPILQFSRTYLDGYDLKRKFFKCAELLVCQGRLNIQKIKEELKYILSIQNIIPNEIDLLMRLEEISDEKVNEVVERALTQIQNGEVSLYRYSYCLEIILMLIRENIINFDEQTVYERFIDGLKAFKENGTPSDSLQVINSLSKSDDSKIKEINSLIIETRKEIENARDYKNQSVFYKSAFKESSRSYFLQEFHRTPFKLPENIVSPSEFFYKGLLNFSNKELRDFGMSLRVKFKGYRMFTIDEGKWLGELKNNIKTFTDEASENRLSHIFLKEIEMTIKELLEQKE